VPSRRQVIQLAELLASAPTVSYHEQEVFARIRARLDRAGVAYASDRWGNLIAHAGPRHPKGRPVAFTAHADHPGLIISSCNGRTAEARWLGGVQKRYFPGSAVRIETAEKWVRGRVLSARSGPNGRIAWARLRLEEPVPPGSIGGWDLAPFRLDGPWIRTKSADDLLGCAAVLSLMLDAARRSLPYSLYGVFTRAEEEGLLGATALAADRTLPSDTAVVVLETSKELPCGQLGKGPIVRVGDRKSVYTPGVCQALHEAAEEMVKRARGFRFQRCLMDGGVCEATAFQAFGYEAGGLALALGNYHNMGKTAIEEEVVHGDDLWNLTRLLPPAAAKIALSRDGLEGLRKRLQARVSPARKELVRSRSLDPPPFPKGKGKGIRLAALACFAACILAGTASGVSRPWWQKPVAPLDRPAPFRIPSPPSTLGEPDPRDAYDAIRYDLTIRVDAEREEIAGSVRMILRPAPGLESPLILDLVDQLAVDSAAVNGQPCTVTRPGGDRLAVPLPTFEPEEDLEVLVRYHGPPGEGDFAGFKFFSNHGAGIDSFAVVSTFSEPENSHSWWPCKDRMDDKALVTLTLETPSGFVVAGNGNRVRVEVDGGLARTTWESGYPISPYLVCFAATNYSQWDALYRAVDGDSVMLQYFAFPEDEAAARIDFDYAVTDSATSCLTTLERLFGPYPFRNRNVGYEKLGIAEVPWGSLAMEHQTCVSLGDAFVVGDSSRAWALTHEIAHQWWGDAVTPTSLDHIWLNEGFATYCEALHVERLGGTEAYHDWMGIRVVPTGTDYLSPLVPPDPAYWFLQSLTYNKGAWVLHMLRAEIGDDAFFAALNLYLGRYRYEIVSTEDFIRAVEESAGRDLHWFFLPWLYGMGRPEISWDWWPAEEQGRQQIRLYLSQGQDGPTYPQEARQTDPPDLFSFHLQVRVSGTSGTITRRVFVGERTMTAVIDSIPFTPTGVTLDPDSWILKTLHERGEGLPGATLLVYPNPSREGATFLVRARGGEPTRLDLFDVQGRKIRSLDPVRGEGVHIVQWNGADGNGNRAPSGIYVLKSDGPGGSSSARVVVVH
jgi:aminopeptidase N